MRCSVCAQEVPEEGYSEHLATEHGVTDDPSAVLFEHLTGDRPTETEFDDEAETDDDRIDDDVDDSQEEEPADDDVEPPLPTTVFSPRRAPPGARRPGTMPPTSTRRRTSQRQRTSRLRTWIPSTPWWRPTPRGMCGAAPTTSAQWCCPREGRGRRRWGRRRDTAGVAAAGTVAVADAGAEAAPPPPPQPEADDPFERMLAERPTLDSRELAQERAAARAEQAAASRTRPSKRDGQPDDVPCAAEPGRPAGRVLTLEARKRLERQRRAATLGLVAVVILIVVAVIALATRDSGTKTASTSASTAPTIATTVAPTFLPGPPGGAPVTTDVATTVAPATTAVPATVAPTTVATAVPTTVAGDPAARIAFSYIDASCTAGQTSVRGTATNNNAAAYSFTFTVQIVNSAGAVLGTANGSVSHLAAHSAAGFVANGGPGSCTDVSGGRPTQQITSITPG